MSDTLVRNTLLVLIGMNNDWITSLSFTQRQRLQFIEAMLIWDGSVQRNDVCKVFDITSNHLTRDIKRYRTHHADALEYDVEARAYKRGRKFKPLFASGSPEEYLALLQAYCVSHSSAVLPAIGTVSHTESMPTLSGIVDFDTLRHIVQALRHETGLTITYQSLSDPDPSKRTIWPHTLVYAGDRWHFRAYDSRRAEFRDFVLARCQHVATSTMKCPVQHSSDALWQDIEHLEIVPAPHLSTNQQVVIAKEFGMTSTSAGQHYLLVNLRKSLVGYFLLRHRLEYGGSHNNNTIAGQHPYLALKIPSLADRYRFTNG
jgi:predicted DNA-binding transcriptional regulator YafY